jgi:hypothetical protein
MTRPNWSKEACIECGNEGLASRGEEHVSQEPFTCSDCKVYNDAFDAGYEAAKKEGEEKVKHLKVLCEKYAQKFESITSADGSGHADIGRAMRREMKL